MNKGLVSVIIPTYNRASLLPRAITSVFNQTYANLDVFIIADNCTDNTSQVLDDYRNNSKIQIIELSENVGGAEARNIGLRRAKGEYIAFLDDDDEWHPEKLSAQIKIFEKKNDVCIVGCNCLYKTKYGTYKSNFIKNVNLDKMLYRNELGSFAFCMIKKEYVEDLLISKELKACQDWELWIKILSKTSLNGFILSESLVYKDKSHDLGRLTTNFNSANEAHWKFICKTEHLMNSTQKAFRLAKYYSRLSRVTSDYKLYFKSIAYLLLSLFKSSLNDIISIIYPYWLIRGNLKEWMKKNVVLVRRKK